MESHNQINYSKWGNYSNCMRAQQNTQRKRAVFLYLLCVKVDLKKIDIQTNIFPAAHFLPQIL